MTQQKTFDPFENLVLDEYEQEIEDSIDPSNFTLKTSQEEKLFWKELATRHIQLKKSKRINIRINNEDIAKVKAKAKLNNIPYQTLLSALIHKYAEGDLEVTL
jgi:predicted DNA binding CopG/RHH family protein